MQQPRQRQTGVTHLRLKAFGGLEQGPLCPEGSLAAMENCGSDGYPTLQTRAFRTPGKTLPGQPAGTVAAALGRDKPVFVMSDGRICAGSGTLPLSAAGSRPKQLVRMGEYVVLFPEKLFFHLDRLWSGQPLRLYEDYGRLEQYNVATGRKAFRPCNADGTVYENVTVSDTAPAGGLWIDTTEETQVLRQWSASQGAWIRVEQTCVRLEGKNLALGLFQGDGVTVSGCYGNAAVYALNGDHVILALYHDPGNESRAEGTDDWVVIPGLLGAAYENDFAAVGTAIARTVPDLDYVVEQGNRLWGCRYAGGRNELRACALGDFRNWNRYQGLSTDSWTAARGTRGAFTGAAVLNGCPLFFREQGLEKVFPAASGAHQVTTVSCDGVQQGSAASLAVLEDRLYYLSPQGVCAYGGSLPVEVSRALEPVRYHGGVAGVLGKKYVLSVLDEGDKPHLLVYDSRRSLWHREDDLRFAFTVPRGEELYWFAGDSCGALGPGGNEAPFFWAARTGDLGRDLSGTRRLDRITLRFRLGPGAWARVQVRGDEGPWLEKGVLTGAGLQTRDLPVDPLPLRTCQVRLSGRGEFRLYSLDLRLKGGSQ